MVKVAVKWNKRVFSDIEVAPNVPDFKAKLQELTVRKTDSITAMILRVTYNPTVWRSRPSVPSRSRRRTLGAMPRFSSPLIWCKPSRPHRSRVLALCPSGSRVSVRCSFLPAFQTHWIAFCNSRCEYSTSTRKRESICRFPNSIYRRFFSATYQLCQL